MTFWPQEVNHHVRVFSQSWWSFWTLCCDGCCKQTSVKCVVCNTATGTYMRIQGFHVLVVLSSGWRWSESLVCWGWVRLPLQSQGRKKERVSMQRALKVPANKSQKRSLPPTFLGCVSIQSLRICKEQSEVIDLVTLHQVCSISLNMEADWKCHLKMRPCF